MKRKQQQKHGKKVKHKNEKRKNYARTVDGHTQHPSICRLTIKYSISIYMKTETGALHDLNISSRTHNEIFASTKQLNFNFAVSISKKNTHKQSIKKGKKKEELKTKIKTAFHTTIILQLTLRPKMLYFLSSPRLPDSILFSVLNNVLSTW